MEQLSLMDFGQSMYIIMISQSVSNFFSFWGNATPSPEYTAEDGIAPLWSASTVRSPPECPSFSGQ